MGCVLSLFKGFDGRATGTVYGKLPLMYRNGRFRYGHGFLYTAPGVAGELQVEDAGLLTRSLERAARNRKQVQTVKAALKDFRYDVFRLDFKPPSAESGPVWQLRLVGAPADKPDEGPIHLTVNVRGALQQVLNLGLDLGGM